MDIGMEQADAALGGQDDIFDLDEGSKALRGKRAAAGLDDESESESDEGEGEDEGEALDSEEERERKDQYVPEVSALDTTVNGLEVDPDTKELLKALNFDSINVTVSAPITGYVPPERGPRRERRNVPGAGRS